uniref:PAB2 n=1 Tax=Arundo donax TaxID=35708 RepID=A0A0A8ZDA1_ARUDO
MNPYPLLDLSVFPTTLAWLILPNGRNSSTNLLLSMDKGMLHTYRLDMSISLIVLLLACDSTGKLDGLRGMPDTRTSIFFPSTRRPFNWITA